MNKPGLTVRFALLSRFIFALMLALAMLPAQAASTFDLTTGTGGGNAAEYTWDGALGRLTIRDNADITITGGADLARYVVVNAKATITLDNASISGTFGVMDSPDGLGPLEGFDALKLNVGANVTLNLQGTNTLKGEEGVPGAGIHVPEGAALTINGPGSLTVVSGGFNGSAGIGGASSGSSASAGAITINSGTITVTVAGENGAGIGGGRGGNGGIITINGGTVTATGGIGGAGIGGGSDGESGGNGGVIAIHGGTVTAKGGFGGAGIGGAAGGGGGDIAIDGGNVTASGGNLGGAGIGSGSGLLPAGTIRIDTRLSTVNATGGPGIISAITVVGDGAAIGQGGYSSGDDGSGMENSFTHPADQSAAAGGSVTFTCAATIVGDATLSWSWLRGSGDGTPIIGANSASLTVTADASTNGEQYRCVATVGNVGDDSSITYLSKPATLTDLPPPVLLTPQTLTGLWYDPAYDGSGFNVIMTRSGLVVYYYGWDRDGNRLWLLSGNGPTEIAAGSPVTLTMGQTHGGRLLAPAAPSTFTTWGSLTITFDENGTAGSATLDGADGKVELALVKLAQMADTP